MSEVDFFPQSAGQFRGSRYPGFSGGTTDQQGNVQQVGPAANVSASTGNNLSPAQVQQQQVDKGNASVQTDKNFGSTTAPSALGQQQVPSGDSFAGTIAQGVLPAVGDIAGTAGGAALGAGKSFGEALDAGGSAILDRGRSLLSGNFSEGLLGPSGGGAAAAGAAGSSISSAGLSGGVPAYNVGTAGVDQLGTNAVSEGIGASGASTGASLGGAGLSGLGTFAAGLISGQDVGQAAIGGIGSAAGAYLGSMILPGVGTVVGSFLGSMLGGLFGNKTPTVGPNGDTLFTVDNGHLGLGITGADNGADRSVTENAAKTSISSINKILDDNNLTIDTSKLSPFEGKYFNELSINQGKVNNNDPRHSPMDVWNNLMKAGAIISKTPSAPTAVPNTTSLSGSTAPVLKHPVIAAN